MFQIHSGYGLSLGVPSTSLLLRLGRLDGSCPAFGDPCRSLVSAGCQLPASPVGSMSTPRICCKAVIGTKLPWGPSDKGV